MSFCIISCVLLCMCVCFIFVHAAFVRFKLMMMMMMMMMITVPSFSFYCFIIWSLSLCTCIDKLINWQSIFAGANPGPWHTQHGGGNACPWYRFPFWRLLQRSANLVACVAQKEVCRNRLLIMKSMKAWWMMLIDDELYRSARQCLYRLVYGYTSSRFHSNANAVL